MGAIEAKKKKSILNDMTEGPILKQMILFSLPLMGAYVLQSVYNIVDMIVVGQFVGASGLSAVGTAGQIINLLTFIGMGLASACQVIISQQVGAKDYDQIKKTVGTSLSVTFLLAILCLVLGVFLTNPLLRLLNTPDESWQDGRTYSLICLIGLVFVFIYSTISCILRGIGDSKLPMTFIVIASLMNIVLDLLFVAVFHMGAAGAAWATSLSQVVCCVFAVYSLYRRRESLHFSFSPASFRINKVCAGSLFRLALPNVFQSFMINFSVMYITSGCNAYGVTASAVQSIHLKLSNLCFSLVNGLGTAAQTMLGQCFGARKHARFKKVFWYGFGLAMIVFVFCSAVCLLFPTQIFGAFTSDPDVIAFAPGYMPYAVLAFGANCSMVIPLCTMTASGAVVLSLIIGILDGVVARIGLAALFGNLIGLYGYWLGTGLAGYVTTIGGAMYFFRGKWKTKALAYKTDDSSEPAGETV